MTTTRSTASTRNAAMLAALVAIGTATGAAAQPSASAAGGQASAVEAKPPSVKAHPGRSPTARPAIDGVLELFKSKPIVALGDVHGLAQEDDFYSDLVRDPRFAQEVGNVVVEFGGAAAQDTIDRYVAGEEVPFTELRRVWTDVVGWFPGESQIMGFVNFFANVRAANAQLPPGQRIKVWLGDPKIDWSQTHTFRDVGKLLGRRDEHMFEIIDEQILKQHRKGLLIVGFAHLLSPGGLGQLSDRIIDAYPNSLAIVAPLGGYQERACNAKVLARAKSWDIPALVGPVQGTWLASQLQLPGCHSLLPAHRADAILYLGPPDRFTQSPLEPSVYLDADYFKELSRRSQCCTPGGRPLVWQLLLRQNSAVARKLGPP
jgi:hypothetical protein